MAYIEFDTIFMEDDAPEVKSLCKMDNIELMEINTAEEDAKNTGDYFVWFTLSSGKVIPCFRGTLAECQGFYELKKQELNKTQGCVRNQLCLFFSDKFFNLIGIRMPLIRRLRKMLGGLKRFVSAESLGDD